MTAPFWIICRFEGGYPRLERFATEESAIAEAERLANATGKEHVVLRAIGSATVEVGESVYNPLD